MLFPLEKRVWSGWFQQGTEFSVLQSFAQAELVVGEKEKLKEERSGSQ